MTEAATMVEVWRGKFLESTHRGHAVICDAAGKVVRAWGDPGKVILPRSSVKMIQALPLVESGAADAAGLGDDRLALACASHAGAPMHTKRVRVWLDEIGLDDSFLACGPQEPRDVEDRNALILSQEPVCRVHNNCSGKHTGMLALAKHLNAELDYATPDNPVQMAIRDAFEDVTGEPSPGFGIDGCSAPNYASSLTGIARAMAFFAASREDGPARERAAYRLRRAMATYPELVSGEGKSSTELMRAMKGRAVVKDGAEGVCTAILPDLGLGIAMKVEDGAARAQEAAITALLVSVGALMPDDPAVARWMTPTQRNYAGLETGMLQPVPGFPG